MKCYIISGEASGDLHGANLMRALLERQPDVQIRFWGGDRMGEVASLSPQIEQVRHIRDLAFMGFVEVLSHLREIKSNIEFCKRDIQEFQPDVMVFIDYPGFNLKIAKFTHNLHIRNIYYISPQIWAWKKSRIHSMRRDLDKLCYILPFERDFYGKKNFPQAVYVGHPLLDEVDRYKSAVVAPYVKSDDKRTIALLSGSRKQELKRMLPLMVNIAKRHPECQFTIAGMSLIGKAFYERYIGFGNTNLNIEYDHTYDLLNKSFSAIVCSGTATLETALFGVPQVVCYQCNKLSAFIARILVGRSIRFISLVNLIADEEVVKELIQSDFNGDVLDKEFELITTDETNRKRIMEGYKRVVGLLEGSGASARTAEIIINETIR